MKILKDVYGRDSLLRARVFEKLEQFSVGGDEIENDERLYLAVTLTIEGIVKQINTMVWEDRHSSIWMIVVMVNTNKEAARQFLYV